MDWIFNFRETNNINTSKIEFLQKKMDEGNENVS